MHREINEAYRAHAEVAAIEEAVKKLNEKMKVVADGIKQNAEYVKRDEQVRAYEKKMHEVDARVRALPPYKAVADKIEAASRARESAQKRIKNLPRLVDLAARIEKETDGQKKQGLQKEYDRLSQQLVAGDLPYQQAVVAGERLNRLLGKMLRYKVRAERRKLQSRGNAIRKSRDELHATLTAAHPDYANLQKEIAAKQKRLGEIRTRIDQRIRSKGVYKNAEQKRHLARKAFDDAGHACRHGDREAPENEDMARLDTRIATFRQEAGRLRNAALKAAGVLGDNPYPGAEAAEFWDHQQNLKHYTTADWDTRTREEIEGRVTPVFREWLLRVRGY